MCVEPVGCTARAAITLPRAERDVLMALASDKRVPRENVRRTRSGEGVWGGLGVGVKGGYRETGASFY